MMNSDRVKALRFSKPDREWIQAWLPLLVLLLGLSSMFVFGNDRGHYYRPGAHDGISSQSMALAANLSPEHNFLMFLQRLDPTYAPYNRFPVGTYALIKLAILPLGDDLSAQIWVGRLLMLLLTAAGAVLAYLALRRLTGSGWIASAATMAVFSSYYVLYYNDLVSTEVTSVFGILLTFHGMVVFEQDGRFRQLLVKTCVAVLLGWHVMALVLPFVVIGLAATLVRAYLSLSPPPPPHTTPHHKRFVGRIRSSAIAALSSRYVRYGAIAGVFCAAVMAFNIANEYLALDRDVPLTRLPTVRSYIGRLGFDDQIFVTHAIKLAWGPYLQGQVSRIGGMSTPYFVDQRRKGQPWPRPWWIHGLPFVLQMGPGDATHPPIQRAALGVSGLAGAFVMAVSAAGVFFMRHKLLIATLLLAGWCWVIPLRTSAGTHEFEALLHIGAPLVFFASGLLLVRWLVRREWVIGVLAVAALVVFILSSFEMSRVGHGAEEARFQEAMVQDFEAIRGLSAGEDVLALFRSKQSFAAFAGAPHAVSHYLAQRSRSLRYEQTALGAGGVTIMRERIDTPALLTPDNREMFAYDSDGLIDTYRTAYRSTRDSDPIGTGEFDVYLHEGALYYVKDGQCAVDVPFFLHIVPANEDDLPKHRRQYGFDSHAFIFIEQGVRFDGKCMAVVALPEYEVIGVETGQYGESRVMTDESSSFIDLYRSAHRRITSEEPAVRSRFDTYAGDGSLTYVRDDCGLEDVGRKFYLHIFPADAGLLSGWEAQRGYENRDFDFWEQGGLMFDGKCMVTVPLPEYEVARVDTGQFSDSEGNVWGGGFSLSGE